MTTMLMLIVAFFAPTPDSFDGVAGVTWESTRESLMGAHPEAKEIGDSLVWTEQVLGRKAVILATFDQNDLTPFAISLVWSSADQAPATYRLFRNSVKLLQDKYGPPKDGSVQGLCPDPDQEFDFSAAVQRGRCRVDFSWEGQKVVIMVQASEEKGAFRIHLGYILRATLEARADRQRVKDSQAL